MIDILFDPQRSAMFALLRTAAASHNTTVLAALAALEVAVALDQSAALEAARQGDLRLDSILEAWGVFADRRVMLRDLASRLVDRAIKTDDAAALNALDAFILIARQNDA